ncbi:MAG: hypothetical protein IJY09_07455 [Lachnospiraceae bacterium]|nr:hypothetical protein [Lachnospiraceae bacterium]
MDKKFEKAEKKTKLKFQGRKYSKRGVASMLLSLVALAGFIAASVLSGMAKGEGGLLLGYLGMGTLIVSIIGFVLGIKSFKEQDILYFQPIFGSVVNGILMIGFVSLYLIGMFL